MHLDLTEEQRAFQVEVRTFIARNYPADLRALSARYGEELSKSDYLRWHHILAAKGWVAPGWPVEHGGPGWSPIQRHIFSEECAAADCVRIWPFGINMVGPVIYTFGTPEQKARFLPPTLSGEIWWCQGYSEPNAGSDLASLRTRADRDGDHYVVNGQKSWTTMAQHADWGFFLVRTDPTAKPQQGISFLLIDMRSPGVSVRPVITLGGEHEVNEVWLENVRVPVENRIHAENQGWTCAKFLLEHERSGVARVARSKRALAQIEEVARIERDGAGRLIDDPFFRRKLTELRVDLIALEITELRALLSSQDSEEPGPLSSLLKIRGTAIQQRLTARSLDVAGHYAPLDHRNIDDNVSPNAAPGPTSARRAATDYFNGRKTSIYGGSNEIQRNIIAKSILGL